LGKAKEHAKYPTVCVRPAAKRRKADRTHRRPAFRRSSPPKKNFFGTVAWFLSPEEEAVNPDRKKTGSVPKSTQP
jgi:hypothetical protein